jgi:hypothetical protein
VSCSPRQGGKHQKNALVDLSLRRKGGSYLSFFKEMIGEPWHVGGFLPHQYQVVFPSIYPAMNCFTLPTPSLDSCLIFQIARLFRSCCRTLQPFDGFWVGLFILQQVTILPEAPLATRLQCDYNAPPIQLGAACTPCCVDSCRSLKCWY